MTKTILCGATVQILAESEFPHNLCTLYFHVLFIYLQ